MCVSSYGQGALDQGRLGTGQQADPYSADLEERILDNAVAQPIRRDVVQDTSQLTTAWIGAFRGGYKVKRKDGKMGLLRQDLTIWVPFLYADIQAVVTGIDPQRDYVLLARRSSHGRYGIINDEGEPESEFVLSFNERLLILDEFILDAPYLGRTFIRHRSGAPGYTEGFSRVWTHPILNGEGIRILNVRQGAAPELALFNLDEEAVVTPFAYSRISRVEPIVGERRFIPLLEGHTKEGIELVRPSGKVLSPLKFAGVEGYNNWKQLRDYFGLPDDPAAEAIAWTSDLEVYVVYADDRVVHLGKYTDL
ncbi:hypothetical protein A3850_014450 [Lewinella sp. 4G2]|nr:hypothetical protein A3850_014450 [Lewinella sp. 4G2]